MAPETAAPRSSGTGKPSVVATGTAMGIMIAKVPQLEPTEKAMKPETKKTSGASVLFAHSNTPTD